MLTGGLEDCAGDAVQGRRPQPPLLPVQDDVEVSSRVDLDQGAGELVGDALRVRDHAPSDPEPHGTQEVAG